MTPLGGGNWPWPPEHTHTHTVDKSNVVECVHVQLTSYLSVLSPRSIDGLCWSCHWPTPNIGWLCHRSRWLLVLDMQLLGYLTLAMKHLAALSS